ncbi:MAG TPA: EAL domain-containing protein, partial [Spirochaetota bacterium]|nr:EAL domain-containing protein [Spirochaetota bacterium]
IKDVLDRTGMPPSCLEIEITESAIVKSMNTAIHVLTQLRELGIKISLDDFGTGYSSLSYLKTLPVDKIKIDRSFIIDIGKNKKTEAVISGIIMLAKIMNLDVIAEGVETAEQADFLILKGCSDIQGFLYSRPLPEEQFTMLLSDQDVVFEKNSWFYYQI